jgi:flagellin-like protein
MFKNKRGISPVIATSLLVLLAIILAVIIFFWARSMIGEKIMKDLGYGEEDIENFCSSVSFEADVTNDKGAGTISVSVTNTGEVPLWGLEVFDESQGSKEYYGRAAEDIEGGEGISIGATREFSLVGQDVEYSGDPTSIPSVRLVPILVGTSESGNLVQYVCDSDEYGLSVETYS